MVGVVLGKSDKYNFDQVQERMKGEKRASQGWLSCVGCGYILCGDFV